MSVTASSTICHSDVVSNGIHHAYCMLLLIKKILNNIVLTSFWPGKTLQPLSQPFSYEVCQPQFKHTAAPSHT
jgi:hypothetical protein